MVKRGIVGLGLAFIVVASTLPGGGWIKGPLQPALGLLRSTEEEFSDAELVRRRLKWCPAGLRFRAENGAVATVFLAKNGMIEVHQTVPVFIVLQGNEELAFAHDEAGNLFPGNAADADDMRRAGFMSDLQNQYQEWIRLAADPKEGGCVSIHREPAPPVYASLVSAPTHVPPFGNDAPPLAQAPVSAKAGTGARCFCF